MSAHDRYLSGFRSTDNHVVCSDCGNEWEDTLITEYGTSYLVVHEECPVCGAAGDSLDLSDSEWEPDWDAIRDQQMFDQEDRYYD